MDGAQPLADGVRRATERGLLTANLIGGVAVAGYFEATAVPATHGVGGWSDPFLIAGYAAFLALAVRRFRRRRFAPATRWALEHRAPDEVERRATLALPRVAGRSHLLLWLNIAISAAAFNYLTHRAAGLALEHAAEFPSDADLLVRMTARQLE